MLTLLTGNRFHHVIDLNAGQSENVQKYKSGIQKQGLEVLNIFKVLLLSKSNVTDTETVYK